MTTSTLGKISCVTVSAPDLEAIETVYTRNFGYSVVERSVVSKEQAELWKAPNMAGANMLIMNPASGTDFVFRFVERPKQNDYVSLTDWGWNASEVLVENVDELDTRLTDGDFEILGEPKNLSFTDDIRAMQLRGPAEEVLYMTELKAAIPGMDLPTANSFVDGTFIVILGGGDINAMIDFYHDKFGVPKADPIESRVTGLAKAFGMDIETRFPIAALGIQDQNMIEVDELPAQAGPRPNQNGMLPPGIAMVSFRCTAAAGDDAAALAGLPYSGRKASCMTGAAGELIELLHD